MRPRVTRSKKEIQKGKGKAITLVVEKQGTLERTDKTLRRR